MPIEREAQVGFCLELFGRLVVWDVVEREQVAHADDYGQTQCSTEVQSAIPVPVHCCVQRDQDDQRKDDANEVGYDS